MTMRKKCCPWTDKELDVLQKIGDNHGTIRDAMEIFPYRSKESIRNKCFDLRISLSGPRPEINEEAFREFLKSRGIDGSDRKPDRKVR